MDSPAHRLSFFPGHGRKAMAAASPLVLFDGHQRTDEKIGGAYDTPTLWGLYDSAPYFHDGSAATLRDALTRQSPGSEHDVCSRLTDSQCSDMIAFLMVLPYN